MATQGHCCFQDAEAATEIDNTMYRGGLAVTQESLKIRRQISPHIVYKGTEGSENASNSEYNALTIRSADQYRVIS